MAGEGAWLMKAERLLERMPNDLRPHVLASLVRQHGLPISPATIRTRRFRERSRERFTGTQEERSQGTSKVSPQDPPAKTHVLDYTAFPGFLRFWKDYPVRTGKGASFQVWKQLQLEPKTKEILSALAQRNGFRELEGGEYHPPNPRTWLHQHRWEDDPPKSQVFSKKTAGNEAALREFVKAHEGKTGAIQ